MELITLSKLLLISSCISHVTANPKVVSFPISRSARRAPIARRDAAAVTLENRHSLYSVNVSIGTPGQQVTLDVDTGSSDIWFFSPDACAESGCIAGTFDSTQSSTYSLIAEGEFDISYADGSTADGDYISDVIDLGGGLSIPNQTMALATSAEDNQYGLFGISFASREAHGADYPTVVDSLFSAGLIESRSYSLWLDDLEASTGTLLFGGYDPDQYTGEITVLDILPDFQSYDLSSFTVDLSMVALSDGSGSTVLNDNEFPIPAILDSGTSLTTLPPDTFAQLAQYFGAYPNSTVGAYLVSCDIAGWKGSVDYGFGGPQGTIIQVPFAELAIDLGLGSECQFGLESAADVGSMLIGDTFLRSAYLIYDLDSAQIGIAQSAWNSKTSNIKAIGSEDDLVTLIPGARNATDALISEDNYATLTYLLEQTAAPDLSGTPMTASISGIQTSLSVGAAPTEPAPAAASTSTVSGGGAFQTAAFLLPMVLPFAAALL